MKKIILILLIVSASFAESAEQISNLETQGLSAMVIHTGYLSQNTIPYCVVSFEPLGITFNDLSKDKKNNKLKSEMTESMVDACNAAYFGKEDNRFVKLMESAVDAKVVSTNVFLLFSQSVVFTRAVSANKNKVDSEKQKSLIKDINLTFKELGIGSIYKKMLEANYIEIMRIIDEAKKNKTSSK